MIALDKLAHALAGAVIAALANPFGAQWAILAALVLGIAKEAFDYLANAHADSQGLPAEHNVDPVDFAWTLAGGVVMAGALEGVVLLAAAWGA